MSPAPVAPSLSGSDLCPSADELSALLGLAAEGEVTAFMRFFDATSGYAFALAVTRAKARGLGDAQAREVAEREAEGRFVQAWEHAAEQPRSGLSPLAWFLSLPVATAPPARVEPAQEAACA